jgi:RimJ/RimL family protein N-acetyltransferase
MIDVKPIVLPGRHVRLVPLEAVHVADLTAALDPTLTQWFTTPLRTQADVAAFVAEAVAQADAGAALPFATLDATSGRTIGTTRFGAIDRVNRHVEIGWTYLARRCHRTAANSEAKLLMLAHAFERWGCLRVEFKTDSLNLPTRTALARLGATEEGTFRNHMVCASGRIRHSVYFSITAEEWPAVKARIEARIAAGGHVP